MLFALFLKNYKFYCSLCLILNSVVYKITIMLLLVIGASGVHSEVSAKKNSLYQP